MRISDWSSDVCSSDLAEFLAIMVATTGIGALLGGVAGFFGGFGAGAAPGAVAGAALGAEAGEWILAALGLKALAEFVVEGLPAIGPTSWSGIRPAGLAAAPPPLPQIGRASSRGRRCQ